VAKKTPPAQTPLGFRNRLVLLSVGLLVFASVTGLGLLGVWLSRMVDETAERELVRHLDLAAKTVRHLPGEDLQTRFTEWTSGSPYRLTLVAPDGQVIADSTLLQAQLSDLDNHAGRPEIAGARNQQRTVTRRRSSTLQQGMLYVAQPVRPPPSVATPGDVPFVLRASVPLSEVDREKNRIRAVIVVVGLASALMAVLMSLVASNALTRTLRQLVVTARSLADGKNTSVDLVAGAHGSDEFGSIARSVAQLGHELRRTVRALAAERDRMLAVLNGMQEGVLSLDHKMRVRLVNKAGLELLRVDEVGDKTHLYALLDTPEMRAAMTRFEAGDDDALEPFEFRPPFAKERIFVGKLSPLSKYRGTVVVLSDVTELRALETLRQDFVANVSHELRTPVAVILSAVEALLDGAVDDPKRGPRFLDAVHRNATRLSHLVSDVLDLARLEAGASRLESVDIELRPSVKDALLSLESAAAEKDVQLLNEVPPDAWVCADPLGFEQVLVNLLVNAVKYGPAGSRVCVRSVPQDDRVRIEVIDEGPGIPEEHHPRLFERFYRVDAGRSKAEGGTGLGLSIVKHLVRNMGGQVGYRALAPGSCFWFALPLPHDEMDTEDDDFDDEGDSLNEGLTVRSS